MDRNLALKQQKISQKIQQSGSIMHHLILIICKLSLHEKNFHHFLILQTCIDFSRNSHLKSIQNMNIESLYEFYIQLQVCYSIYDNRMIYLNTPTRNNLAKRDIAKMVINKNQLYVLGVELFKAFIKIYLKSDHIDSNSTNNNAFVTVSTYFM